jgi:hypothetical protein
MSRKEIFPALLTLTALGLIGCVPPTLNSKTTTDIKNIAANVRQMYSDARAILSTASGPAGMPAVTDPAIFTQGCYRQVDFSRASKVVLPPDRVVLLDCDRLVSRRSGAAVTLARLVNPQKTPAGLYGRDRSRGSQKRVGLYIAHCCMSLPMMEIA